VVPLIEILRPSVLHQLDSPIKDNVACLHVQERPGSNQPTSTKDRHLYGSNRLSANRKTCAIPSVYPALVQMGPTCRSFRKRVPSFTSSWRSLSDRQSPEIPSGTLPRSKLSARFSRHYGGNPAAYAEGQDPRMHRAVRKQSAGETHERSRTCSVSPSFSHPPSILETLTSVPHDTRLPRCLSPLRWLGYPTLFPSSTWVSGKSPHFMPNNCGRIPQ
jgi:hypothetical protein